MDIRADYTATEADLAEAIRNHTTRRPVRRWLLTGFWVLVGLFGLLGPWVVTVIAVTGLALIWATPALHRKIVLMTARRFSGPTVVRITGEGLDYAVGATRHEVPWASVTRVTDNPVAWAVASNLKTTARVPVGATVLKAGLTPEQQAEFAAFLAADSRLAGKVHGPVGTQFA
ncbi:hypothetical protein ACIRPK_18280 [Kitasatospora sp. NPDC101801]|uniref:hypothetical protein n=1 Tax=Kitasatospora sp. NPDC101801 TaxID=3364103 RepID=UPI00380FA134